MDEKIKYWLDLADYDFETAKAMQKTGRRLYVGFMCHQTIEKSLKAIIAKSCEEDDIPPKSHNLLKLAELAKVFEIMSEEQQDFLRRLNPLNVESRYPEYKQQILAMLTKEVCKDIMKETEELLCWIRQQLEQ